MRRLFTGLTATVVLTLALAGASSVAAKRALEPTPTASPTAEAQATVFPSSSALPSPDDCTVVWMGLDGGGWVVVCQ